MRSRPPTLKSLFAPDAKAALEQLYVAQRVPTDQLKREQTLLRQLAESFKAVTGIEADPDTLLRYMINRRKKKDWPKLGAAAIRFTSLLNVVTPSELDVLKELYVSMDVASDNLLFMPSLAEALAVRFRSRTGRSLPSHILVAVIVAHRKRGSWPEISGPQPDKKLAPFSDIAEVAARFKRA